MSRAAPPLEISTAPFLKSGRSTRRLMWEVVGTLMPVVAVAAWFFGLSALLVVAAAALGAAGTEWGLMTARRGTGSLGDGSAIMTGVLLGLTLPPAIPLWIALLGGVVSIALGKAFWGGLGQNLFNPALVGRAFLQAAFPGPLTTWTPPVTEFRASLDPATLALPFARAQTDVVTTATPLGLAKFEGQLTELLPLLLGNTAGSLGETSALLLAACGLYLGLRRIFDWRLPVATLVSVALLSEALHFAHPERFAGAPFMLLSGGLMFGAVFMVTDPVTTPITPRGAWIFGAGVGALVVLIRFFGGLPEGVMYAILLMNSLTPLINRATQPRRFGR